MRTYDLLEVFKQSAFYDLIEYYKLLYADVYKWFEAFQFEIKKVN